MLLNENIKIKWNAATLALVHISCHINNNKNMKTDSNNCYYSVFSVLTSVAKLLAALPLVCFIEIKSHSTSDCMKVFHLTVIHSLLRRRNYRQCIGIIVCALEYGNKSRLKATPKIHQDQIVRLEPKNDTIYGNAQFHRTKNKIERWLRERENWRWNEKHTDNVMAAGICLPLSTGSQ